MMADEGERERESCAVEEQQCTTENDGLKISFYTLLLCSALKSNIFSLT